MGNLAYNPTLYSNYVGAVNLAINYFQTGFTTIGAIDTNINIVFGWGSVTVGGGVTLANASTPGTGGVSPVIAKIGTFADVAQFASTATAAPNATAAQKISWGLITSNLTDPTGGGKFTINPAQIKLLDPTYATDGIGTIWGVTAARIDGGSVINSSFSWNWTQSGFTAGQGDAVSVQEHEISEILGRSMDGGSVSGGMRGYTLMDFYDYSAAGDPVVGSPAAAAVAVGAPAGRRLLNVTGTIRPPQTYFSADGVTVGLPFTVPASSDDIADWNTTLVPNDSFGSSPDGVVSPISANDVLVMNTLGLVSAVSAPPPAATVVASLTGGGTLNLGFDSTTRGAAGQMLLDRVNAGVGAGTVRSAIATSGGTIPALTVPGTSGELLVHSVGAYVIPGGYATALVDAPSQVTVSGGSASGQLVMAGQGGLAFNAGAGAGTVFAGGGNNLVSMYPGAGSQNVDLGSGDDTVIGLSGDNNISAGLGNNQILLGTGANTVNSTGNDLIAGGSGTATISSGSNAPVIYLGSGVSRFNGAGGRATVVSAAGISTMNSAGNAQLWLGGNRDVVNSTGADTVIARTGAATVNANSGNMFVFAGSGSLDFHQGSGASTVLGAAGASTLHGGAGSLIALAYAPTVYIGGSGADTIAAFGAGAALTATGGSGTGVYVGNPSGNNSITGGSGTSVIFGGGAGDVLTAGTGAGDTIKGGTGAETISAVGTKGVHKIYSGTGPELIRTGDNNTSVLFGTGRVTIESGSGVDLYAVTAGNATDVVIKNFQSGSDYLALIGFRDSLEALNAVLLSTTNAGSQSVTLSDGTHILFQGFTGLTRSNFL